MILQYSPKPENFLAFYSHAYFKSPSQVLNMRAVRYAVPIFLLLIGGLSALDLLRTFGDKLWPSLQADLGRTFLYFFWWLIMPLLFFILAPWMWRSSFIFMARQLMKEGWYADYLGPRTLSLLDDGIREAAGETTQELAYASLKKIVRSQDCFFIYRSRPQGFVVPLSAFADEGQVAEFSALIKEKSGLEITAA